MNELSVMEASKLPQEKKKRSNNIGIFLGLFYAIIAPAGFIAVFVYKSRGQNTKAIQAILLPIANYLLMYLLVSNGITGFLVILGTAILSYFTITGLTKSSKEPDYKDTAYKGPKYQADNKPVLDYYQTEYALEMFAGPGTEYLNIEVLPKGLKVKVVDILDDEWCEIEKRGYKGYVKKKYLSRIEDE